jgi:TPP-dependent pyruvate/acetoin dehydrogenase alpha subunit
VDEGEFHETLNLSMIWRLPVLFVCENNLYAMGMAIERADAETHIARQAASYRMPTEEVDGMDVVAGRDTATRAVEAARNGGGPHFLELRTYRFRPHSMYDPELYRDKAEVAQWKERDPIPALIARAELAHTEVDAIESDAKAEIDDAVAFAEQGTDEPVDTLTRFVTSELGRT